LGEECCRLYNRVYSVPVAICRFFNVYGPRQPTEGDNATVIGIFEGQKRKGLPLTITGTGQQRRDFTHVDDVVSGLIVAAQEKWNCDVLDLGRGRNYSIKEVADMFEPDEVEYLPPRDGEAQQTLADVSMTERCLGWQPCLDLEDYIQSLLKEITDEQQAQIS